MGRAQEGTRNSITNEPIEDTKTYGEEREGLFCCPELVLLRCLCLSIWFSLNFFFSFLLRAIANQGALIRRDDRDWTNGRPWVIRWWLLYMDYAPTCCCCCCLFMKDNLQGKEEGRTMNHGTMIQRRRRTMFSTQQTAIGCSSHGTRLLAPKHVSSRWEPFCQE